MNSDKPAGALPDEGQAPKTGPPGGGPVAQGPEFPAGGPQNANQPSGISVASTSKPPDADSPATPSGTPGHGPGGESFTTTQLFEVYKDVCNNIRVTDDISFKLLGIAPLASGLGAAALTLLEKSKLLEAYSGWAVIQLSALGALITLALFLWERRNIQKCLWLITRAARLEREFRKWPLQFRGMAKEEQLDLDSWEGIQVPYFRGGKWGKTGAEALLYTCAILAWLVPLGIGLHKLIGPKETTMKDEARLKELNRATFKAEEGGDTRVEDLPWDEFLRKTLADDFVLRRSNPALPDQDRDAVIAHVRQQGANPSRTVGDERVILNAGERLGVVVCSVTLTGADGKPRRYKNVKVFRSVADAPGGWQLLYWQVTEAPLST